MTATGHLRLSSAVRVEFVDRARREVAASIGAAVTKALTECQDAAEFRGGVLDPTFLWVDVTGLTGEAMIGQRPRDVVLVEVNVEAEVPL